MGTSLPKVNKSATRRAAANARKINRAKREVERLIRNVFFKRLRSLRHRQGSARLTLNNIMQRST